MMQNEKTITFDKLPEAVGYLTEQVIELKKMVSELKPSSSEKRVLIEIEDACRIIHKAKATIYTLRQFGIRKKSKELQLCRSFSMYWQSLRLVVKETICRECGAEVDEEVVYRAVA